MKILFHDEMSSENKSKIVMTNIQPTHIFIFTIFQKNIFLGHQVHHSSEYYNMGTALRQSMWHKYYTFPAYIPMG